MQFKYSISGAFYTIMDAFDFHFLCRHFPRVSNIHVLAKSKETYLSMTWKIPLPKGEHKFLNVIFLDSFRFLPSSLLNLIERDSLERVTLMADLKSSQPNQERTFNNTHTHNILPTTDIFS